MIAADAMPDVRPLSPPPGCATLPPRGGRVEVADGRVPEDAVVIRASGCGGAYSALPGLLASLGSPPGPVMEPGGGDGLAGPEVFEDALRRATVTNWWDLETFESYVGQVQDALRGLGGRALRVRDTPGVDLPTMRVLLTAFARLPGGGRRLCLEGVRPPGGNGAAPALSVFARDAALHDMALSMGAGWPSPSPTPGPGRTDAPRAVTTSAVAEFLHRNDPAALEATDLAPPDQRLMRALVAARHGRVDLTRAYLEEMERESSPALDRARACSLHAVTLARSGGAAGRDEARRSVGRGFVAAERCGGDAAAVERGWLHNNAALLDVLSYLDSGDRGFLAAASRGLARALDAATASGSPGAAALRSNAIANAVRLLELEGRFSEAGDLLRLAFSGVDVPAVHYRMAALELCQGHVRAALAGFETARAGLARSHWPFQLAFLHGFAYAHAAAGQVAAAADYLHQGLDVALAVRSRPGALVFGSNLVRCLRLAGGEREARILRERLAAEESVTLPAETSGTVAGPVSMPPSKLPPYVPEIDLATLRPGRVQINRALDHRVASCAGGRR